MKLPQQWNMVGRATPFSPITGICNLCPLEKYHILLTPELANIKKNEDINSPCLQKSKVLLDKA